MNKVDNADLQFFHDLEFNTFEKNLEKSGESTSQSDEQDDAEMTPVSVIILGMVGLILMLFHVNLGEHLVNYLGMEVSGMILFDIFNGIIWGCIYGVVGFIIDLVMQRISITK